jgi:hypothetical protein
MVLWGTGKQKLLEQRAQLPPARRFARNCRPQSCRQTCIVETLQDYKTMVADETTSVVAVRFYAPGAR